MPILQDLRYGIRMLVAKPGFTITAVSVLALGIGANTAIFSLVNALLLKPLAWRNPLEIVGVYSRDSKKPDIYRPFSYPNYADLREGNSPFTSLMAHIVSLVGVTEGNATRRVFAEIASSNYFETLGVSLWRGRTFTAAEERPASATPVAIVSYSYWQRNGADPDILGKTLRVNGRIFTVVGITPQGFTGTTALVSPELYLPLGVFEAVSNDFEGKVRPLASRDNHTLILVGRLRPGITQKQADQQLAITADRIAAAYPAINQDQTFIARPLSRTSISTQPTNDSVLMIPLVLLLSVAGVVLLIASLNVANMMLARGTSRGREISIRLALGGGRKHILQQIFIEGLLLALLGGAAGLLIAFWSTDALIRSITVLAPVDLVYTAGPDVRVLAATGLFCVLSTLLFGLGPAWSLSQRNVLAGLKDGDHDDISRGKPRRLFSRRNMLVMGQVALSLALLTAAGLFVRSAMRAAAVDPGFQVANEIVVEVDPSLAGYDEAKGRQFHHALLDRLNSVPGVESVSIAATVPFGIVSLGGNVEPNGGASTKSQPQFYRYNIVSEDYFKTLGIPLARGRTFERGDTNPQTSHVAILDRTAVQRLWPAGDPVGKHVRLSIGGSGRPPQDLEVVGVVNNVQEQILFGDSQPHIYVPFGQAYQADMNFHLKAAVSGPDSEARLFDALRRAVRGVDNQVPILAIKTLRGHMEGSADFWVVRTGARLFGIFGGVALLLAMIGLYGVRAYAVARRTREIGIRMALGAASSDALGLILREGLLVTAIGAAIGLALSVGVARVLANLLYGVHAFDPVVLLLAPLALAAVSVAACYIPARRAARVDPMVALRDE